MNNWFNGSDIQQRHYDVWASLVLGNQWWDEWKWKITDRLMQESDVVIRFQWWHNAWHTVIVWDKAFDLHILPSWMVSDGKTNIITSGCVLGIDLNKIDIEKIKITQSWVSCNCSLEELLKRKDWDILEVGLIPELKKLQEWWIDISRSWLKISQETIVIWMHNVLLDAFDEICRRKTGQLKEIGSTWSWISRAYSSEIQRFHFSLNDLLYNEDLFYGSIEALWEGFKHIFTNITSDDLIKNAKKEREKICEHIRKWNIEIIWNERQYIKSLHSKWKKIVWEWAQSSMIWSGNSFFWTASDPSLHTFSKTTGLTSQKVWNIFLIHKMPSSSVWERPGYLKHSNSPELDIFRDKYWECWVSTWRARDLLHHSLCETARWAWLNVRWIDDESKIVPVYNRIDWIEDSLKLDNWLLRVVTWFKYMAKRIVDWPMEQINVWVLASEALMPKNLLKNYPEKSAQATLFGLTREDLRLIEIKWDISSQIEQLLWYYNSAIFRRNSEREYLVWTWPDRDDLDIRKGRPLRRIR